MKVGTSYSTPFHYDGLVAIYLTLACDLTLSDFSQTTIILCRNNVSIKGKLCTYKSKTYFKIKCEL